MQNENFNNYSLKILEVVVTFERVVKHAAHDAWATKSTFVDIVGNFALPLIPPEISGGFGLEHLPLCAQIRPSILKA